MITKYRLEVTRIQGEARGVAHPDGEYVSVEDYQALENRLAEAVAAEREACAKVCDEAVKDAGTDWENGFNHACGDLADAIRARGEG